MCNPQAREDQPIQQIVDLKAVYSTVHATSHRPTESPDGPTPEDLAPFDALLIPTAHLVQNFLLDRVDENLCDQRREITPPPLGSIQASRRRNPTHLCVREEVRE
jgi:hypothetical protein